MDDGGCSGGGCDSGGGGCDTSGGGCDTSAGGCDTSAGVCSDSAGGRDSSCGGFDSSGACDATTGGAFGGGPYAVIPLPEGAFDGSHPPPYSALYGGHGHCLTANSTCIHGHAYAHGTCPSCRTATPFVTSSSYVYPQRPSGVVFSNHQRKVQSNNRACRYCLIATLPMVVMIVGLVILVMTVFS